MRQTINEGLTLAESIAVFPFRLARALVNEMSRHPELEALEHRLSEVERRLDIASPATSEPPVD